MIKGTWKVINSILNSNEKQPMISKFNDFSSDTLEPLNNILTDEHLISNKFNNYFTKVGSVLSNKIIKDRAELP